MGGDGWWLINGRNAKSRSHSTTPDFHTAHLFDRHFAIHEDSSWWGSGSVPVCLFAFLAFFLRWSSLAWEVNLMMGLGDLSQDLIIISLCSFCTALFGVFGIYLFLYIRSTYLPSFICAVPVPISLVVSDLYLSACLASFGRLTIDGWWVQIKFNLCMPACTGNFCTHTWLLLLIIHREEPMNHPAHQPPHHSLIHPFPSVAASPATPGVWLFYWHLHMTFLTFDHSSHLSNLALYIFEIIVHDIWILTWLTRFAPGMQSVDQMEKSFFTKWSQPWTSSWERNRMPARMHLRDQLNLWIGIPSLHWAGSLLLLFPNRQFIGQWVNQSLKSLKTCYLHTHLQWLWIKEKLNNGCTCVLVWCIIHLTGSSSSLPMITRQTLKLIIILYDNLNQNPTPQTTI